MQLSLFNKIYLVLPYIFSNFAHRNLRIVQLRNDVEVERIKFIVIMGYIDEMNKTFRKFLNQIDELLENDPDIDVNSVDELRKKVENYGIQNR